MTENGFVDYYEVLQLSQQADTETIERVFRMLAKRYHPDNPDSGDEEKFKDIQNAFKVLQDPELRAKYDIQYDRNKSLQWRIFQQGTVLGSHEDDRRIFNGVLSLLYVARRRNPESGGLGSLQLEQMLGVPREHLEFPLWVLRKRGWIEILDTGQVAITVDGIDQVLGEDLAPPEDRLLARAGIERDTTAGPEGPGEGADEGAEEGETGTRAEEA